MWVSHFFMREYMYLEDVSFIIYALILHIYNKYLGEYISLAFNHSLRRQPYFYALQILRIDWHNLNVS